MMLSSQIASQIRWALVLLPLNLQAQDARVFVAQGSVTYELKTIDVQKHDGSTETTPCDDSITIVSEALHRESQKEGLACREIGRSSRRLGTSGSMFGAQELKDESRLSGVKVCFGSPEGPLIVDAGQNKGDLSPFLVKLQPAFLSSQIVSIDKQDMEIQEFSSSDLLCLLEPGGSLYDTDLRAANPAQLVGGFGLATGYVDLDELFVSPEGLIAVRREDRPLGSTCLTVSFHATSSVNISGVLEPELPPDSECRRKLTSTVKGSGEAILAAGQLVQYTCAGQMQVVEEIELINNAVEPPRRMAIIARWEVEFDTTCKEAAAKVWR